MLQLLGVNTYICLVLRYNEPDYMSKIMFVETIFGTHFFNMLSGFLNL